MVLGLALLGLLFASVASSVNTPSASTIARTIVTLISVTAAGAIAFSAIFLARFGAAFGGRLTNGDFALLWAMWGGVVYFTYCSAILWSRFSWTVRSIAILAHLFLMPAVAIVPILVTHSPERGIQIAIYLFLGACYALLWLRIYDAREHDEVT